MKTKNIDNFLTTLTSQERKYLLEKLKQTVLGNNSNEVVKCPCCQKDSFFKKGTYKDVQKYKCKITSKIFTYKTRTVLTGVQDAEKFEQLIDMLGSGKFPTLDDIQEKLCVARKTAHDWRTKIITAVYKRIKFDNQLLEFDDTGFRISRKARQGMKYSRKRGGKLRGDNNYNVKVFMTYSRTTGALELFQSHMGRTSEQDLKNYFGKIQDVMIYSDRHPSYKKFYWKNKIKHRTFLAENHISLWDKNVHNQTLNYYSRRLHSFLDNQLHGVSTKYLQGYLNWFMFIENCKKEMVSVKNFVMDNKVAVDIFKQKEKEFQYFLKINGRNNYGTCNDRYYGRRKRVA